MILAPERLPKLGFVDLGTEVCLGLMFLSGIVAWFCCFLGLLSSKVGLGFWELEKSLAMVVGREQGEGKTEKEKTELKRLKLNFHMDFRLTLDMPVHRTWVF